MASTTQAQNPIEPFKVYVRIRPFLPKELTQLTRKNSTSSLSTISPSPKPKSVFAIEDNILFLIDPTINSRKDKEYIFDGVFDQDHNNQKVFED